MNFEITPNMNDKKWTCVFYWNEYTTLPTLDLFYARYLQFAETVDKYTGLPKLIGYVQFKRPMAPEDLFAINVDIYWVNQRGRNNLAVINWIDRIAAEKSFPVTRLGTPFPMRDSNMDLPSPLQLQNTLADTPFNTPSLKSRRQSTQPLSVLKK